MLCNPSARAAGRCVPRSAFALPDLLALCVCAGMLLGAVLPIFGSSNPPAQDADPPAAPEPPDAADAVQPRPWPSRPVRLRDGTQLKQIHQAFIIFAQESEGSMPLPGLIRRLPVNGQYIPGRGEQDITLNTTANLYSAMIMQNYFTPELCVSSWERSDNIKVNENFNWDAYNPTQAIYWDDQFNADLTKQSHTSYAHLLLTPKRQREWRDSMRSDFIHLSNRGPKDGKGDPASITCDHEGKWAGHVVFGDNATAWGRAMTHKDITLKKSDDEESVRDNFFAIESETDIVLTFTQAIDANGKATLQHD